MKRMAIVLAAGQGKRMKSKLYKVLHPVCGTPMVGHVLNQLEQVHVERTVTVVGHGAEAVKAYLGDRSEFVLQEQQLGTGHAVKQAKALLSEEQGTTIVICGDTPLVTSDTLMQLMKLHESTQASATILTAELDQPFGYGRLIRTNDGSVLKIVEQKDATEQEQCVREINTGTYCFDNAKLFAALEKITNDNAQNEYYLTDVISILQAQGDKIQAYCTQDQAEYIGVNDRMALSEAERMMRERINKQHMVNGVTIIDPANTYIEAGVTIGADTVLEPGTILRGETTIGEDCHIGPHTELIDCTVDQGAAVAHSVMQEAVVGANSSVGPFAYLRPGANIGQDVKIGDFVEIKNATIGDQSKVSHLSYVGDAKVGNNVNIGCGAITVNYDGYNKSITEIGDNAFIGSNVNLIAPIQVGQGAYVVAGSTITQHVNDDDVAIARGRQENKPGYAPKLRARAKAKKEREARQQD
ncbi:bifunctional UDP-N-acetylglucosamine diphosphorylase/glucosamine-1-phosphate N-acetyltransferase GlmU [Paenibacillus aquistagni]|uniref:Bifunctional protein GlmU n=1 Tax=Paenibacillus aquistagni TaxID=1852522 RepID=A0A1X7LYG9_9BACL|nr:bifunctional UDP-N-acetylglucosamine diphosphorylase/glucosamine-1-phosphate N-acetyltransferase GlmU [Paenibacillus aquistagni]SMG58958.1 bifunctional UDP-N-acetylglucosamine pyrophosphorylase / Glucosamine-1-phosphate N-acetyltransferase [Paenibacillus aquistagni]